MSNRLNSIPPMGNPVTERQVTRALKKAAPAMTDVLKGTPQPAIPDADETNNTATLNTLLATLRTLGLIAP